MKARTCRTTRWSLQHTGWNCIHKRRNTMHTVTLRGRRIIAAGALLTGLFLGVGGPLSQAYAAVPNCAGHVPTIIGTPSNDIINGTPGDDVIVGMGGNDTINAGAGNDIICTDTGNDT